MERQPWDGLPALMMADQKGNDMTVAERKINTEDLISFEEIAKEHKAGEYLAVGNDGKEYHASYVPKYRPSGVMFFCIPADVEILGYLKIIDICNKSIPCCGCVDADVCTKRKN